MEKDFLKLQEAHEGQQALLQKLQVSEMCYNKWCIIFLVLVAFEKLVLVICEHNLIQRTVT